MKKYCFSLIALAIVIAMGMYLYRLFFSSDGEFCLGFSVERASYQKEWKAKGAWAFFATAATKKACEASSNRVQNRMLRQFKEQCVSGVNLESWMTPSQCKELLKTERLITAFDVRTWDPANQQFDACMIQSGFYKAPTPNTRYCKGFGW